MIEDKNKGQEILLARLDHHATLLRQKSRAAVSASGYLQARRSQRRALTKLRETIAQAGEIQHNQKRVFLRLYHWVTNQDREARSAAVTDQDLSQIIKTFMAELPVHDRAERWSALYYLLTARTGIVPHIAATKHTWRNDTRR